MQNNPKDMLQLNQMLLKLQFEQQAEWKEMKTGMLPNLNHSQATYRPENPGNHCTIFTTVDFI